MGLLDGITLSGGECLLCPGIGAICKALKRMGFRVKLDSNGCRPEVLRKLLEDEVIDYVALDYKAPRGSFEAVTGREAFGAFSESLDMLIGSGVDFETRTTVHSHWIEIEFVGRSCSRFAFGTSIDAVWLWVAYRAPALRLRGFRSVSDRDGDADACD